ncbi:hypothetical protein DESUT3_26610 [Desulfuromonas versatilis]|uniref:Lipoprotein n=1 Tax=Desulfuromonas versatilis TaxID=2802975 RepID=A0ABM8HYH4_9BACT|nr:hypothetical protein [Desulfuromonas versatilis]BCR05592.1 hypothetical protein DESUT3_26610 [Desulfuromonas versatilis]
MRGWKWIPGVLALGLLALVACTTTPKQPALLDPQYSQMNIRTVAILPVVFRDRAIDALFEYRIGEEIRWHARKVLGQKGYDAAFVEVTENRSFVRPFRPDESSPAQLANLVPTGSDAVLIIWVEHFLDAGGFPGHGDDGELAMGSIDPLEIYASADLIATSTRERVWSDQGYGRDSTVPSIGMQWWLPPLRLADSLFTTLPDAGAGKI